MKRHRTVDYAPVQGMEPMPRGAAARLENTADIGLPDSNRRAVCGLLNKLLADEFLLYGKTLNFHWSVTGMQFGPLHALFQTQQEELDGVVDAVAERVRMLGQFPIGSLKEFLENARLGEHSGKTPPAQRMIGVLLADHEALARTLRGDVETCVGHGDAGTADFLTGLLEKHEKTAWILRSHLGD